MSQEDDPERQRLQVPGAAGNLMYGHGQTNNHHMTKVQWSYVSLCNNKLCIWRVLLRMLCNTSPEFCSGDTLLTSFLLPSIILLTPPIWVMVCLSSIANNIYLCNIYRISMQYLKYLRFRSRSAAWSVLGLGVTTTSTRRRTGRQRPPATARSRYLQYLHSQE